MSAVPQALRQGSLALGANRMQTTLAGGRSRRPVRHRRRRSCSASPGRSGETMIVALAAGAQTNLTLDPREGMQTMTGFIAQTAGGENPVGSTHATTRSSRSACCCS